MTSGGVESPALLSIRGLSKSFPGQVALDEVDLDVHSGEVVAIVGQNGSGKSTLVKLLTGIHDMDPGGSITVHDASGRAFTDGSARDKIHVIHQDLGLISMLNTIENLGLDRGHRATLLPNREKRERARAEDLIGRFGITIDVRLRVDALTPGERTIVALARALNGWQSPHQVLLLDEPTAALHGDEAKRLFAAVRAVAEAGAAVVFISHRLDEVLDVADRVVALRGGRVVADVPTTDLDRAELIRLIAGRTINETPDTSGRALGEVALSVRGLQGSGIESIDLSVRAGEIVGVCGILGSGREHLCGMIFGTGDRESGDVRVGNQTLLPQNPRAAIKRGVGFVPADRHAYGAVMGMSARENLTLPGLRQLRGQFGGLNRRLEQEETKFWTTEVELDPLEPDRSLELFSGGNQQKIVLAKWLRNRPPVLLLDEPTQGVDVGAKAAIYSLVVRAAAEGAAVVVSSSDTAELAMLCDRVVVLRDGNLVAEIDHAEATEARLVAESLGSPISAHTAVDYSKA